MSEEGKIMSKSYTDEFKRQTAQLRESGKSIPGIMREYSLSKPSVSTRHKQFRTSGAFTAGSNRGPEDKEPRDLRKEPKRLQTENGIVKQAALIPGRKDV
jgi:transposase